MCNFTVVYSNQPRRNRAFKVRGVCEFDVLNPCYDARVDDKPGLHWGGFKACKACTDAAKKGK